MKPGAALGQDPACEQLSQGPLIFVTLFQIVEQEAGLKDSGHPGTLLGTEHLPCRGCSLAHWAGVSSGLGITSGAGVVELASAALYQATTQKTLYRVVPHLLCRIAPQEL